MPIIAYLGTNVKEYREKARDLLADLGICCPKHPEKPMAFHDTYLRTIKETSEKISIHRLICHICHSTKAVLPDFLFPYKHYSADEIEFVVMKREKRISVYDIDTSASICTVRRWLGEMRKKATAWISKLKSLAIERFACPISEAALYDLTLIEQIEHISQKLPKIKFSGNLLGYAALYTQSLAAPDST